MADEASDQYPSLTQDSPDKVSSKDDEVSYITSSSASSSNPSPPNLTKVVASSSSISSSIPFSISSIEVAVDSSDPVRILLLVVKSNSMVGKAVGSSIESSDPVLWRFLVDSSSTAVVNVVFEFRMVIKIGTESSMDICELVLRCFLVNVSSKVGVIEVESSMEISVLCFLVTTSLMVLMELLAQPGMLKSVAIMLLGAFLG